MRESLCLTLAILACLSSEALFASTLQIKVVDVESRQLPCRVHFKDASGVSIRAEGLPFWHDHFVCAGFAELRLRPGRYDYEIERGPEYERLTGSVEIVAGKRKKLVIALKRITNMSEKGWWSGELHVHRRVDEMPLHLRAEDLHVAPVITWWNEHDWWRERSVPENTLMKVDQNRYYDVMAGEDEREGGALLYYGLKKPLPLPGGRQAFPEYPSPVKFIAMARQQKGVWIDIEKPFWWDTPVWLASGQINSMGLANNHMCRSSMLENEAWGKARDEKRWPPPRGNGYWTQEIYYHVLNSGFRLPPSAGSASGVLENPVGYNRAYVHVDADFSYDRWWEGLKAGRSFVTNGPLLLCRANQFLPGHVFQTDGTQEIELAIEVISKDRIPAVEIIVNGRKKQSIPLELSEQSKLRTQLTFQKSGWFLVRAIVENPGTFRFASTAPYYVEIGKEKTRISRRSVQFFLDWLEERSARVPSKLDDEEKLGEVLQYHDKAKLFWRQLMQQANAT